MTKCVTSSITVLEVAA